MSNEPSRWLVPAGTEPVADNIWQGPQGEKGDTGATGATGATGPAGASSLVTDIEGLDNQIVKGNLGFRNLYNKIAPWTKATAATPSYGTPTQVNYGLFGDSTAGLVMHNNPSSDPKPYPGVMRYLELASAPCQVLGQDSSITVTGTAWEADNSAGKYYDYTVHPAGRYWHVESGATLRSTSAIAYATEFCCYYIKESGGGTGTLQLRDNTDATTISVNSVSAELVFSCDQASLGAGKAGFLYQKLDATNASAGQFKLTFGGQTTADLAYNISAANLQTALAGLSSIGAGNVGVTLSGTTWTILIKSTGTGWHSLDWKDGTTALTGYLTADTVASAHLKLTASVATMRCWGLFAYDRSRRGVCLYGLGRAGLRLGDTVTMNASVAATIFGDMKFDLASFAWTYGQAGQHTVTPPSTYSTYTQAELETNLSGFFTAMETAYANTDWIVLSFPPAAADPTDVVVVPAIASQRTATDTAGHTFIDLWTPIPGWSYLSALGTDWTGDGVHLGNSYNAFCGSIVARQLGLYDWSGISSPQRFSVGYSLIGGIGLDFSKAIGGTSAGRIRAEQTYGLDMQLQVLSENRCFSFLDSGGSVNGQIGTYDGGGLQTWLKNPLHLGTYDGPLLQAGAGSPEGSKTAPIGSLFLRTDGGANTTLYVKESGTGNTGWVAK